MPFSVCRVITVSRRGERQWGLLGAGLGPYCVALFLEAFSCLPWLRGARGRTSCRQWLPSLPVPPQRWAALLASRLGANLHFWQKRWFCARTVTSIPRSGKKRCCWAGADLCSNGFGLEDTPHITVSHSPSKSSPQLQPKWWTRGGLVRSPEHSSDFCRGDTARHAAIVSRMSLQMSPSDARALPWPWWLSKRRARVMDC